MKTILLAILLSFKIHAQVPTNNDCSGAILLTNGNPISSSTDNASNSDVNSLCGFYSGFGNVWYKFVAPNTEKVFLNLSGGSQIKYSIQSNCNANNEVSCGQAGETLITSLEAGLTYYIVIEKIPLACKGDCDLNFTISISENSLSQEQLTLDTFSHYPNPVQDELTIKAKQIINKVEVYTVLGYALKAKTVNALETKIDFSDLQSGIYFINIYTNNRLKTYKIIKN